MITASRSLATALFEERARSRLAAPSYTTNRDVTRSDPRKGTNKKVQQDSLTSPTPIREGSQGAGVMLFDRVQLVMCAER
jgi:hypothetical protein